MAFKILFWHSNLGRISYCDIQNAILTFELGSNIVFWHSISYFDIQNRAECCILTLKNTILTLDIGPNIVFWYSKSYFDIRTEAEYHVLTLKILFWHSTRADFRILTFKILSWHLNKGCISYFDIQNPILTLEIGPNIVFWHSQSYSDIQTEAEFVILTLKILFWHLK